MTDASGRTVASGVAGVPAVELTPGAYTVTSDAGTQPVTVESGKTATVKLR